MLVRLLARIPARQLVMRNCVRAASSSGGSYVGVQPHGIPPGYEIYRQGHLDEFPVPEGSWKEAQAKLQAKNNQFLALSVAAFLGTILTLWYIDVWDFVRAPPMTNPPLIDPRPLSRIEKEGK